MIKTIDVKDAFGLNTGRNSKTYVRVVTEVDENAKGWFRLKGTVPFANNPRKVPLGSNQLLLVVDGTSSVFHLLMLWGGNEEAWARLAPDPITIKDDTILGCLLRSQPITEAHKDLSVEKAKEFFSIVGGPALPENDGGLTLSKFAEVAGNLVMAAVLIRPALQVHGIDASITGPLDRAVEKLDALIERVEDMKKKA